MSVPSTDVLRPLTDEIIGESNVEQITIGQLRAKLNLRLSQVYTKQVFDLEAKAYRDSVKEVVAEALHDRAQRSLSGTARHSSEKENDQEGRHEKQPRIHRKPAEKRNEDKAGLVQKKAKKSKEASGEQGGKDAERLHRLKAMAQAMGASPWCFKGFPEMNLKEKVETLKERLQAKGATFVDVPTDKEIRRTLKARMRAQDLEGVDPDNMIESGKRRRVAQQGTHGRQEQKLRKSQPAVRDLSESSEEELIL